jgi:uncharacterized protein YjfI (DUF2170 family)
MEPFSLKYVVASFLRNTGLKMYSLPGEKSKTKNLLLLCMSDIEELPVYVDFRERMMPHIVKNFITSISAQDNLDLQNAFEFCNN